MTTGQWQIVRHNDLMIEIRVLPGTESTNHQPFILLSDVQDVFPTATRFQIGNRAVSFLVDPEGNRLTPLRVLFYPGIALDVILSDPNSSPSLSISSHITDNNNNNNNNDNIIDHQDLDSDHNTEHDIPAPEYPFLLDNTPAPEYTLSSRSLPPSTSKSSLSTLSSTATSFSNRTSQESILSTKESLPALTTATTTATTATTAFPTNDDNTVISIPAEARYHCPQVVTPELLRLVYDTADISRDQLHVLKTRISKILSQHFSLHDLPFPHLFIVLPSDPSDWDPHDLYGNKFQVFFLCNCSGQQHSHNIPTSPPSSPIIKSSATTAETTILTTTASSHLGNSGNTTPRENINAHRLHLAAHQGYELENTFSFLKKYGAQILSLLQMFRYNIQVPGYATPTIESLARELQLIKSPALSNGIELAIYRSIDFLDGLLQSTRGSPFSHLDSNSIDSTASYFDPEYENIMGYLKSTTTDEGLSTSTTTTSTSIAEMYRVVTPEGNVEWLCQEHYKPINRPTISSSLRGFANGTYNSKTGSISITLKNNNSASTVFTELAKTKSIVDLTISLEWSVGPKELKSLVASLEQNTSIISVTLNCSRLSSPINFLGRNKKISPVLKLMSLSRLRSFSLGEMDGFLACASSTPWFSQIRSLHLTGVMDWRQQNTRLGVIFKNCPKISEFGLHCINLEDAFTTVSEVLKALDPSQQYQFKRLNLSSSTGEKAQVDYYRTQVSAIDLVVHSNKFPYHFLALGAIRKITFMGLIDSTCSPDQQMLENIAKTQPHLAELHINCLPNLFRPTYELIRNLSLIEREKFSLIQSMVLTFHSNTLTISDINDPSSMALELKGHLSLEPKAVITLLREFGCALVDWEIHNNAMYTFPSAAIIGIDVPLKENYAMNGEGDLKLERLHITASNLEPNDLHKLSPMILNVCPRLKEFCIDFRDNFRIDVMFQYAWGEWISTVSSKITSILIHGDAIRELRFLERTCLLEFPKIKKFWITLPATRQIEPVTYLHLMKQLEMFSVVPGTKPTLPSYSLTNPTTPEDFPIAVPVSYSKSLSRSSLEFYNTSIGSSYSLELSDQSSSLFRRWPGLKMSPELTSIGLEFIGISKAGWAKLTYMIDILALEELSFKGSNITDEIVRILQGRLVPEQQSSSTSSQSEPTAKLKVLNLENCYQISSKVRNDLRPWMEKHLPECTLLM